jgi:inorganic pyrophosphatase/exopolyphosphatase
MDAYAKERKLDLLLLFFTGLEINQSAFLYAGKETWIAEAAFEGISNERLVFFDVVSRKKQVMPALSAVIEGNGR